MISQFNQLDLEKKVDILTRILGYLSFFSIVVVLIWSCNKSFDFSDESFYSIGYHFNIDQDHAITFFHKIYNFFFGFLNLNLGQNRLLGLILTLVSVAILCYNASSFFNVKEKSKFYLTGLSFSLLSYFIYPMALSYNSIAGILGVLILSVGINYLKNQKRWKLVLLGALSMLIILNKFTTLGFVGFTYFLLYLSLYKDKKITLKTAVTNNAYCLLGATILLLFFFPSLKHIRNALGEFSYGLTLSTNHGLEEMISRFLNESWRTLTFTIYLIPLFVILALLKFNKINTQKSSLIIISLVAFLFTILTYKTVAFSGNYNVIVFYYLIIFTIIPILIYNGLKSSLYIRFLGSFAFLFIPFLLSFGTNNSLFIHFTFSGGIFGIGLYLLLNKVEQKIIKNILLLFIFPITSFIICYNKINHPYRAEKLTKQTIELKRIPYLKNIYTTSQQAELINEIALLKTHPAKKIFVCAHQLGISLILNKEPLLFSWIDESSAHLIEKLLSFKSKELKEGVLVFIPNEFEAIKQAIYNSKELNLKKNFNFLKSIKIEKKQIDIYESKLLN